MQTLNLVLAQSIYELEYILKKINKNLTCLPLNLETLIYCKKKKLNHINPINFLDNELHKEALIESKKLIEDLKYDKSMSELMRVRCGGMIRKFFNSSFFVYSLVNKIKDSNNVSNIYVSGWDNYYFRNKKKTCFISKICTELFGSELVKFAENKVSKSTAYKRYKYVLDDKIKVPKNSILLPNLGYNFKRIVFCAFKTKFKVICLSFDKISLLKKLIFYLLRVDFHQFKKIEFKQNKFNIIVPNINYLYKQKNFSELLNFRKSHILNELLDLQNQCEAISNFLAKNKPALILLNMVRGYNGFYAEISRKLNIPSLCISHGTVSKSFDKYDAIYQNIIAEEVFSGKAKYYALQSKIKKNCLSTVKISGTTIETGNIIFSETKQKKKKYILYAVTNRGFENMHYYGIETYYEYLQNLELFDKMAKRYNLNFLIKPHPGHTDNIENLRSLFKNLKFTKIKIEKALRISVVTISYSSTVIEDSLCSKIPVILFDQWKRYLHCDAQKNPFVSNQAVYYVTNESDLLQAINSAKKSKKINFADYVYEGSYKKNIHNNVFSLAND